MKTVRAIVTDIEGTTSPIAFVRDVLFPYARQALPGFLQDHHDRADAADWIDCITTEQGLEGNDLDGVIETLLGWIDQDRKHTALKALQGMIWLDGYQNGSYTAPIYADAMAALRQWHSQGIALYVYSSGSVPAQKLFFEYSEHGDVRALFSGYFDTQMGSKREVTSYTAIATTIGLPAAHLLFLSDIVEELDAARAAGWQTALVDRAQDYAIPRLAEASNGHPRVTAFNELTIV